MESRTRKSRTRALCRLTTGLVTFAAMLGTARPAEAAFSGTTTRTVCGNAAPGVLLMDSGDDERFCTLTSFANDAAAIYHPYVDQRYASTAITCTFSVSGINTCGDVATFNTSGVMISYSGQQCTTTGNTQDVVSTVATLPTNGTADNLVTAAVLTSSIFNVGCTWLAVGVDVQ